MTWHRRRRTWRRRLRQRTGRMRPHVSAVLGCISQGWLRRVQRGQEREKQGMVEGIPHIPHMRQVGMGVWWVDEGLMGRGHGRRGRGAAAAAAAGL